MPTLRITTRINAAPEKVFEYVTAYGAQGILNNNDFEEKCGKIQRQEGGLFFTREKDNAPSGAPGIDWKCSFEYPNMRVMEALSSGWADRKDTFKASADGTRWTVEWNTKIGGFRGIVQFMYFKMRGKKAYFKKVVEPVREHFQG